MLILKRDVCSDLYSKSCYELFCYLSFRIVVSRLISCISAVGIMLAAMIRAHKTWVPIREFGRMQQCCKAPGFNALPCVEQSSHVHFVCFHIFCMISWNVVTWQTLRGPPSFVELVGT